MSWSGIAGSYDNSIFSFLRNLHTVFHSGCTNLHSHQQRRKVLFPLHSFQHLLFEDILIMDIMTHVKWHLILVLVYKMFILLDLVPGILFNFIVDNIIHMKVGIQCIPPV